MLELAFRVIKGHGLAEMMALEQAGEGGEGKWGGFERSRNGGRRGDGEGGRSKSGGGGGGWGGAGVGPHLQQQGAAGLAGCLRRCAGSAAPLPASTN